MNRVTTIFALAAALATPSALATQPASPSFAACEAAKFVIEGDAPDLQGRWDFVIQAGETPSRGVMALGPMDGAYAGSLTPETTNSLAVRRLTLDGGDVHMSVASREGEVRFEGHLAGRPDTMCGTVHYHGGQKLKMVAVRRPTRSAPG